MRTAIDKLGKVAVTVEKDYWSNKKTYDKLTIVEKKGVFGTYISRKAVPAGIDVTNREYWIPFSSLKEEIVLKFNELANSVDEKEAEIYNAISSIIVGGVALKQSLGNSEVFGISQKKITEEFADVRQKAAADDDALQTQITDNDTRIRNIADEEDLTMVSVDEKPAIKLRDKAYEPEKYSGLGRKYLRKNITYDVKIVNFGGFVENVAVQAIGGVITDGNSTNVVYDRIRNAFLYREKKDLGTPAKYYDVWTSEEVNYDDYYQSSFTTGYTIRTDVVFMLGDVPYHWDENDKELAVWDGFYEAHSKNIITQDMINEPNTIYHIQYDYDLNGQSITVPEGCTLEFNGGSFKNGIVNAGNDINIKSDSKCFENIRFAGQFLISGVVKLLWFITKFAENIQDTSVDNTEEVQYVMGLGLRNVEFPTDKFIRLTDTIHVNTATNILADRNTGKFQEGSFDSVSNSNYRQPCVFSKNVATLFDYQIERFAGNGSYPFTVGPITLLVDIAYSDLKDKEIPILRIETNGHPALSSTYGVLLYCNIVSVRKTITIDEHTDSLLNYTGIYINAKYGPLTFIKIHGNIFGTYYGVITDSVKEDGTEGSWITDIEMRGNTWCCYGGWFKKGSPAIIYGSHQCHPTDNTQEIKEGYFYGSKIYLIGNVWDCGSVSARGYFVNASYPIKIFDGAANTYMSLTNYPTRSMPKLNCYGDYLYTYMNPVDNAAFPYNNVLPLAVIENTRMNPVYNLKYMINGVNILTDNSLVKNADSLFNERVLGNNAFSSVLSKTTFAYVNRRLDNTNGCKISFTIRKDIINGGGTNSIPFLIYRYFESTHETTISIEHSSDGENYILADTLISSRSIYATRSILINLKKYYDYVRINIEIKNNKSEGESGDRKWFILPTIIVPSYFPTDFYKVFSSAMRPKLNSNRKGFSCFDTTLNKIISWNGSNWVDSDGFPAIQRKGSTAQRPVGVHTEEEVSVGILKPEDIGFEYFDTTLNKKIYVKEIDADTGNVTWIEEDGAIAGVLRSGTAVQMPSLDDVYDCFEFYRTDLNKKVHAVKSKVVYSKCRPEGGFVTIDNPFDADEVFIIEITKTLGYWAELYKSVDGNTNDGTYFWKKREQGTYRVTTGFTRTDYPYLRFAPGKNTEVTIKKILTTPIWLDEEGFTPAISRGTTTERPTSILSLDDSGFEYYDTNLGKPIYLKVIEGVKSWVDATGAEV